MAFYGILQIMGGRGAPPLTGGKGTQALEHIICRSFIRLRLNTPQLVGVKRKSRPAGLRGALFAIQGLPLVGGLQPIIRQFLPADLLLYKSLSALFMRVSSVSFSLTRVAPIETVTHSLLFL